MKRNAPKCSKEIRIYVSEIQYKYIIGQANNHGMSVKEWIIGKCYPLNRVSDPIFAEEKEREKQEKIKELEEANKPDWQREPLYKYFMSETNKYREHIRYNTPDAKRAYEVMKEQHERAERKAKELAEQEQADKEMADLIASEAEKADNIVAKNKVKKGIIKHAKPISKGRK